MPKYIANLDGEPVTIHVNLPLSPLEDFGIDLKRLPMMGDFVYSKKMWENGACLALVVQAVGYADNEIIIILGSSLSPEEFKIVYETRQVIKETEEFFHKVFGS